MKRIAKALTLCVIAFGTFSRLVEAQVPLTGPCSQSLVHNTTWYFFGNGSNGRMTIYLDSAGNLQPANSRITFPNGSVDSLRGYWTASACKLTFVRTYGTDTLMNPYSIQVYTGFVFPSDSNVPTSSPYMAGSFQTIGGSATRHEFGWFAYK